MKLYFVRHGHSEANVRNVLSNREHQYSLTSEGKEQASALAQLFADKSIAHIWSSPLLRARQTAEFLGAVTGASIEVSQALREYDMGLLEGRSDEDAWAQYWALSDDWLRRGLWDRKPEGGESFFDIHDRFMSLINRLRAEDSDNSYVLLGHGGPYRCMLPMALANVDFSFTAESTLDHTRYVMAEKSGASFICRQWVDRVVEDGEWLHNQPSPGPSSRASLQQRQR